MPKDRMIDVSVIVPCYNAQEFVEDCLHSILSQTGVCVEIIAIDDASEDFTKHILRSISADNENVVVRFLEKNGGQAAARNVGLEMARGEFVAFLDADDYYLHDSVLSDWVSRAREDKLDLCTADIKRKTKTGVIIDRPSLDIPADQVVTVRDCPQLSDVSQCWQILYRREFLERNKLRFSSQLRQREDRLFFLSCLVRADRVGNIGQPLIVYRAHEGSTMTKVDREQLKQFSLHIELLAPIMASAHEQWEGFADFETANAARYWTQGFGYWRNVLLEGIHKQQNEETGKDSYHLDDFVKEFFARLHYLTRRAGPVFSEPFSVLAPENSRRRDEGDIDIARIAVSAGDFEGLAQVLSDGRIHITRLMSWCEASEFEWAPLAVNQYLRFNRGWSFVENKPNPQTPRLQDLVKKVVLHIGMPKTGSSSLQEFLEINRLALLDKGVWYPDVGVERGVGVRANRTSGQALLVQSHLRGKIEMEAVLAQQISQLSRPVDTVFLSVENIFSERFLKDASVSASSVPEIVEILVRALDVPNIEVWTSLRRQDGWFQSYYREIMANPFNGNLMNPTGFWDALDEYGIFDYEGILHALESSPLISAVKVTTTGQMRKNGGSIQWFLSEIGLTDTSGLQVELPLSNTSYSDAIAANVRLLKAFKCNRALASRVFEKIVSNEDLKRSGYSMITSAGWAAFQSRFAGYIEAYDTRFPGEAPVTSRETEPEDVIMLEPALLDVLPKGLLQATDLDYALGNSTTFNPASRKASIDRLNALNQIRGELDRRAQYTTQLEEELNYMRNSVSWRITAPLRSVMRRWRNWEAKRLPTQSTQEA